MQRARWLSEMGVVLLIAITLGNATVQGADQPAKAATADAWKIGEPIVTYWGGPTITDADAKRMAAIGINLVWCHSVKELDVAHRHGLRGMFSGIVGPATLDNPERRKQLDAMIEKVRNHPAMYAYFVRDEPGTHDYPGLKRIKDYLLERDPKHLAYINLYPTYANATQLGEQLKQLGTKGDTVTAYTEYVHRFIAEVHPQLLSYDHYQFHVKGDLSDYFLNLALMRQFAQEARLPFLNIVQAASWDPVVRVPNAEETRYLVYTTLAYGAQGISYYVYCEQGHKGGIMNPDDTPTPIYAALKKLNPEFSAIAKEYQPLRSLAVYHAGMNPRGTHPLPTDAPFRLDPPVASMPYKKLEPVKGVLLGYFGPATQTPAAQEAPKPTHVLAVNLDYTASKTITLVGPGDLEVFDADARTWSTVGGRRAKLDLLPGGGKFVRLKK